MGTAERLCDPVLVDDLDAANAFAAAQADEIAPTMSTLTVPIQLGEPTIDEELTLSEAGWTTLPMRVVSSAGAGVMGVAARTNLPHRIGGFVGRRAEIEAVAEAVTNAALVTVVGSPGVGKSRLAKKRTVMRGPEVA